MNYQQQYAHPCQCRWFNTHPDKYKVLEWWAEHFNSLLNQPSSINYDALQSLPQRTINPYLDILLSEDEVADAIRQMSTGKAPEPGASTWLLLMSRRYLTRYAGRACGKSCWSLITQNGSGRLSRQFYEGMMVRVLDDDGHVYDPFGVTNRTLYFTLVFSTYAQLRSVQNLAYFFLKILKTLSKMNTSRFPKFIHEYLMEFAITVYIFGKKTLFQTYAIENMIPLTVDFFFLQIVDFCWPVFLVVVANNRCSCFFYHG